AIRLLERVRGDEDLPGPVATRRRASWGESTAARLSWRVILRPPARPIRLDRAIALTPRQSRNRNAQGSGPARTLRHFRCCTRLSSVSCDELPEARVRLRLTFVGRNFAASRFRGVSLRNPRR